MVVGLNPVAVTKRGNLGALNYWGGSKTPRHSMINDLPDDDFICNIVIYADDATLLKV